MGKAGFVTLALVSALGCSGGSDGPASPSGGGPAGAITVGSGIQFVSRHNASMNPAVDTVAVGDTVTWNWSGGLPHSVRSVGAPGFVSSGTKTGAGTYKIVFTVPGTYHYDCAVHGQAMTGTIVVTGAGVAVRSVADPLGDTFNTGGVAWDLTALTLVRDTGGVTVAMDFATDVISPMSGDVSGIIGFVELDLDQDSVTGSSSAVDAFRHDGGATGLGVDATIDMSQFAADSTVAVYDSLVHVTGRVKPAFQGRRITIRVPRSFLGGDDGWMNVAAIIGSTGRPTDLAPNAGHLALTAASAASLLASARLTSPWRSGRMFADDG